MDSPGFSFEASIPFWEDNLGEASYQKFEHLKLMVKHAGFEGRGTPLHSSTHFIIVGRLFDLAEPSL